MPRFLAGAKPVWKELDETLNRLENSPDSPLELQGAERFYRLYQQTSAHLAEVRHLSAEQELRDYLENLVGRCYARIYVRAGRKRTSLWRWFVELFPAAVRRHSLALLLSVSIFAVGGIFGAVAIRIDSTAKAALLPFGHGKVTPTERVNREKRDAGRHLSGHMGRFSAELMTHNTKVAFFTLGLGMTFGLGTIVMLFYNGVIIGAIALDYVADGQAVFLLGWLLPHGSIEIPAILLAGQAGLILGHAMVGWGNREPLRLRMRQVLPDLVTIAGGVAVLLAWAGLIESFFSQYHEPLVPYIVKIAFGTAELCALAVFLALAGRGAGHESAL